MLRIEYFRVYTSDRSSNVYVYMKKNFILGAVIVAILSYGVVITPQTVEAACSYNGYLHSEGKCGHSFKWEKKERKDKFKNHHDDDDHDDHDEEDDDDDDDSRSKGNYHGYDQQVYLRAYIQQLVALLSRYDSNGDTSNNSDVDVRTIGAINVDEDSATIRAIVDMNTEDTALLYFEYGKSSSNLTVKTSRQSLDAADDGDTQEESISGLSDNTRYYFRAVAVDENGDKDYGVTTNFITDSDSSGDDEDPFVTTQTARTIDTDSAELRGTVDMNDFENGITFFVYGEDESQVRDVEDDFDTYEAIDEDGDSLQKVLLHGDVDGTGSFSKNIAGLDNNTDIFFSLCVEYEKSNSDETLICGSVREFRTE